MTQDITSLSVPVTLRDEAIMHLDGIVHFADGFAVYHDQGPAGQALRDWINGARSILARVQSEAH